jgi:hypothetical protein
MAITVDIADRLYDYTDEEKAAEAIAGFQEEFGLDDTAVLKIWQNEADGRRAGLERLIIAAVDANGSVKRAADNIPGEIILSLGDVDAV